LLEKGFDVLLHLDGGSGRPEAPDWFPFAVAKELGKVPLDSLPQSASQGIFEVAEEGDGVFSIHLHLREEREGYLKAGLHKLEDLGKIIWLLPAKLIAREGKHFKAFILVLLVKVL